MNVSPLALVIYLSHRHQLAIDASVDRRAEQLFGAEASKRILKVLHFFSLANNIERYVGNNELIFDRACRQRLERNTRYAMLVKVSGKDTETVINALIKNARKLPEELYKSVTWDRGKESNNSVCSVKGDETRMWRNSALI